MQREYVHMCGWQRRLWRQRLRYDRRYKPVPRQLQLFLPHVQQWGVPVHVQRLRRCDRLPSREYVHGVLDYVSYHACRLHNRDRVWNDRERIGSGGVCGWIQWHGCCGVRS